MIYDYEVTTGKGETLKLSEFQGKVILVVSKVAGRITAVIIKAIANGRTIAKLNPVIGNEDTSAVIGEIRSTHNANSFGYTGIYSK